MPDSLAALLYTEQRRILEAIRTTAEREAVPAYLVGGAVRDWLLNRRIDDLDFAVEGDAIAFAHTLTREQGGAVQPYERFRTATWFVWGQAVDIVTARSETYERPAALPRVAPATIRDDLLRRDFTVDALALALRDDRLIDVCDGQSDLHRRLIRALHPRSFVDDPTRIFRAARYAARLNFAVEEQTRAWIKRGLPYVRALSGERVKYDVELIFLEQHPPRALECLRRWGLFRALSIPIPEDTALEDRFTRIAHALSDDEWDIGALGLPREDLRRAAGWAALTYNLGQMSISRWIDWIPFTADVRDALVALGALSSLSPAGFHAPPSRQSALLNPFSGLTLWLGWLFERDPLKRQAMRAEWHVWRRVQTVTTGDTLKARGLPPGPRYRELLARLRDAWLDGKATTAADEERLLNEFLAEDQEPDTP
ncbi:MAG: hypothetical protein RMN25_08055 [Anaerolineae bacterium]|nr:hypothetical protein [Thermoflexales bacterium]MDW8407725.1 hypothetical protein [Anaerolineae bacterium]